MADLWDKVKKTATELYASASEKAVEGVNLGVKKLDEVNLRRELSREFAGLGGRAYQLLEKEEAADMASDPTIRRHLARLKELEARLEEKEREIQGIRSPRPAAEPVEVVEAEPSPVTAEDAVDATTPRD